MKKKENVKGILEKMDKEKKYEIWKKKVNI